MKNLGDRTFGSTIRFSFNTYDTGSVPFTFSGGALSVYKDNNTTGNASGISLTVDFASITGFNKVSIDTSADQSFYTNSGQFSVIVASGTVDGVSVVGSEIAYFTLGLNSSVQINTTYDWVTSNGTMPTTIQEQ